MGKMRVIASEQSGSRWRTAPNFEPHRSQPNLERSPDLVTLTQPEGGRVPYIEVDGLRDAWEREFVYEPQNINQNSRKPRIYSQGPDPGNPSSIIANW